MRKGIQVSLRKKFDTYRGILLGITKNQNRNWSEKPISIIRFIGSYQQRCLLGIIRVRNLFD